MGNQMDWPKCGPETTICGPVWKPPRECQCQMSESDWLKPHSARELVRELLLLLHPDPTTTILTPSPKNTWLRAKPK